MAMLHALTVALIGCAGPAWVARGSSSGVYSRAQGPKAVVRLPTGVQVQSIVAAADSALVSAGYTVTARDSTSARGRVVARASDPRIGRRVTIEAHQSGDAAGFDVLPEPPDAELAFSLMERVLTRLGL